MVEIDLVDIVRKHHQNRQANEELNPYCLIVLHFDTIWEERIF